MKNEFKILKFAKIILPLPIADDLRDLTRHIHQSGILITVKI
jgi:hypothetical protein